MFTMEKSCIRLLRKLMVTKLDTNLARSSFIDHLRIERGLSENSLTSYGRDLKYFLEFLQDRNRELSEITASTLSEFEVWLKDRSLAISSINRTNSAVKSFLIYCAREYSLNLPTGEISSHRVARKLPKALTIDEVALLIESAKSLSEATSLRDVALLELLYSTGGRVSEIIGININDLAKVESDNQMIQTIKLRGKGAKERIVPIGSYALTALDNYLVRIRPALMSKSGRSESALFLNSRGSRLSRQSAWSIVLKAARACGLEGKVSPHVFRHSYATHLLDGGADIRVVQELLGHSSVTTTQIYTLVTIDRIRQSYSSAHPRAR
jgi:integrase/recombinase XerD